MFSGHDPFFQAPLYYMAGVLSTSHHSCHEYSKDQDLEVVELGLSISES
jgi:hypothetical protein